MVVILIKYSEFISQWNDEGSGPLFWLLTNVGKPKKDWKATTHSSDYAKFWFKHIEDAVAFKIIWG